MNREAILEGTPPKQKREWVRTFLFSMRIHSPLARLHVITKIVLVFGVSMALLNMISSTSLDPVGCVLLVILAFVLLWLAGVIKWLFRSYLVMIYPTLISLFLTWIVFNPNPGTRIVFERQVYAGTLNLGISVPMIAFVAIVVGYYLYTKQLYWGIVGGAVVAILINQLPYDLSWTVASFSFFRPLTLLISDQTIYVAVTKVLGYAAMALLTFLLILTSRDIEVIGALRKVPRMPFAVCLFSTLMLRSLNVAVIDYSTIRQAQVARGINVRKKNIVAKLGDYAYLTVPLIATMMRHSIEMSDALIARGYEMGSKPTIYREVKPLRAMDWLFILATLLFVVVVRYWGLNFTETVAGLAPGLGL